MTTLNAAQQLELRRLLERGLPLQSRPYQILAEQIGVSEQTVLEQVQRWNDDGLFRRFGLVLHHRALGFRANAMLVMDIPDQQVDAIGAQLSTAPGVNLCYQRPRRLPHWRYNLFAMVHGRSAEEIDSDRARIRQLLGSACRDDAMLVSSRILKKTGLRLARRNQPAEEKPPCSE